MAAVVLLGIMFICTSLVVYFKKLSASKLQRREINHRKCTYKNKTRSNTMVTMETTYPTN